MSTPVSFIMSWFSKLQNKLQVVSVKNPYMPWGMRRPENQRYIQFISGTEN